MKKVWFLALISVLCLLGTAQAGWDPYAEKKALDTIVLFLEKDPTLNKFFEKAAGVAVFPTVGKGGVGIGGAHGTGTLFEDGKAVGSASLTQVTVGFQLGGQAYSQLIFFENQKALDRFNANQFELSAQASAVAATAGAAATADYSDNVAIFSLTTGGLMYEASVGGQKFKFQPK